MRWQLKFGCVSMAFTAAALAQPATMFITSTPAGSISNPDLWKPVLRYEVDGSSASSLSAIPTSQVFDPSSIAFRSGTELLVGNRHGNFQGAGSIGRFTLATPEAQPTPRGSITAPNMFGVHQIAVNPVSGELVAASVSNGLFRFSFNAGGDATFVERIAQPSEARGVIFHPNGRFLYVSAHSSSVYRFRIESNGNYAALSPISIPGSSNLHYFGVSPANRQLYVADISSNVVKRLRADADGGLTVLGDIPATNAMGVAFSPDGSTMYVSRHFGGGILIFNYDATSDGWTPAGSIDIAESLGGVGIYNPPLCPADLDDGNGAGVRDLAVTIDDLIYFLNRYFDGGIAADLDDGTGSGLGDGGVTIDDLIYFLTRFSEGC